MTDDINKTQKLPDDAGRGACAQVVEPAEPRRVERRGVEHADDRRRHRHRAAVRSVLAANTRGAHGRERPEHGARLQPGVGRRRDHPRPRQGGPRPDRRRGRQPRARSHRRHRGGTLRHRGPRLDATGRSSTASASSGRSCAAATASTSARTSSSRSPSSTRRPSASRSSSTSPSVRDPLTRAYNRRYLVERLASEIAYAKRHTTHLALILFDLDHFKRINDTHGHLAGDDVLREVSALMQRLVRAEDVFARFGGEEFVLLVRGNRARQRRSLRRARAPGRRAARDRLGSHRRARDDQPRVRFAGGARRATQRDADGLLRLADERLYKAKTAGRNRVSRRLTTALNRDSLRALSGEVPLPEECRWPSTSRSCSTRRSPPPSTKNAEEAKTIGAKFQMNITGPTGGEWNIDVSATGPRQGGHGRRRLHDHASPTRTSRSSSRTRRRTGCSSSSRAS